LNLQLTGLHAVVTGGSSGIGAAIVQTLAAEGCRVSFCARRQAQIDTALGSVSDLPGAVRAQAIDVTDSGVFDGWLKSLDPFDIFVPNVSALSKGWKETLLTDVSATVSATEAAIPILLKSQFGVITYIGSKAGSLAAPASASYGAGKAAMAHYMKSLALRLAPRVRVNTVSPGDTLCVGGLWDQVRESDPELFKTVLDRNPLNRLATPEEIARVVAFISSPVASFVVGANWYVDGGSTGHVQF
jgi:NAD(P)-dependent dehydrogenase (short-subunit alcohol dehydrogenase family)